MRAAHDRQRRCRLQAGCVFRTTTKYNEIQERNVYELDYECLGMMFWCRLEVQPWTLG